MKAMDSCEVIWYSMHDANCHKLQVDSVKHEVLKISLKNAAVDDMFAAPACARCGDMVKLKNKLAVRQGFLKAQHGLPFL